MRVAQRRSLGEYGMAGLGSNFKVSVAIQSLCLVGDAEGDTLATPVAGREILSLFNHYIMWKSMLVMENAIEGGFRHFLSRAIHFFLRHAAPPKPCFSELRLKRDEIGWLGISGASAVTSV